MYSDESANFNLNELDNITGEQSKLIQNILQETNPLECEMLGKKTVEQIAKGKSFDSVEGGRHLSFVETISVISGIATVIQLAIFVIGNMVKKSEDEEEQTETDNEQVKEKAKEKIKEIISSRPELKKLEKITEQDNEILDKIINETIKNRKTEIKV